MEIIGLMSGTSLDGCDIAHVKFETTNQIDSFKTIHVKTYPYNKQLTKKLTIASSLSSFELLQLDKELGNKFSEFVNDFITKNRIKKDRIAAIASHGHTIFHQPQLGISHQIGCGLTISNKTNLATINDFRKNDVLHGGQGAPLVPIGDFGLFNSYADAFLNIGGFSNISYKKNKQIIAYDICPGNLPLNRIVSKINLNYDHNGAISKTGKTNTELLKKLNNLNFYKSLNPKSLGTEWLEEKFMPLLNEETNVPNCLRTICEHISDQISSTINKEKIKKILITGGGAKNNFLIDLLKIKSKASIIIPQKEIIDFKEAIIFGYMGYLYLENRTNCLSTVTGASKDVIGGTLYQVNNRESINNFR